MFARFKEFTVVMIDQNTLVADESLWSNAQTAWLRDWADYVATGGTRPPKKPPL